MHVSSTAEFDPPKGLLELMTQLASKQKDDELAQARAQAQTIRAEARQRAAERSDQALRSVQGELEAEAKRARERAEAEAYMAELTTKDRITEEILDGVRARLAKLAESNEFKPVLEALLRELMAEAPEDAVVLAPKAHEETVKSWLRDNGFEGVQVETLATLTDGVAVQDAKRTQRVTNTLSARLTRQEASLRKLCLQRLHVGEV